MAGRNRSDSRNPSPPHSADFTPYYLVKDQWPPAGGDGGEMERVPSQADTVPLHTPQGDHREDRAKHDAMSPYGSPGDSVVTFRPLGPGHEGYGDACPWYDLGGPETQGDRSKLTPEADPTDRGAAGPQEGEREEAGLSVRDQPETRERDRSGGSVFGLTPPSSGCDHGALPAAGPIGTDFQPEGRLGSSPQRSCTAPALQGTAPQRQGSPGPTVYVPSPGWAYAAGGWGEQEDRVARQPRRPQGPPAVLQNAPQLPDHSVVTMLTGLMESMKIMAANVQSVTEAVYLQSQPGGTARPEVRCDVAGGHQHPPKGEMRGLPSEPSAHGEVWRGVYRRCPPAAEVGLRAPREEGPRGVPVVPQGISACAPRMLPVVPPGQPHQRMGPTLPGPPLRDGMAGAGGWPCNVPIGGEEGYPPERIARPPRQERSVVSYQSSEVPPAEIGRMWVDPPQVVP